MSALVVRKDKLKELLTAVEEMKEELPKGEEVAVANINSVRIAEDDPSFFCV
jgi:predicted ribosome-associated RNA-binding protein Tma20